MSWSQAPPPLQRFLVLFDFDETIINESSDDAMVRTTPGKSPPDWLREGFQAGCYHAHMCRVLAYLDEQGVREDSIRAAIEALVPAPGVPVLFAFLLSRPQDFECAIISDANAYFIDTWLRRAGVRQLFNEVLTNPASFSADGRLVLRPFHAHTCPRCPENMCKQAILRDYLARRARERGSPFQRVFYVGDGDNDICPTLALGQRDTACPRRGFPMHRILQEMQENQPSTCKAAVVPWASGEDVVDCLQRAAEER
ncbi:putative phosphatase phospho1 [Brachyhypopomus gauderio]|uniref:putative phosphatase phospho1 n=1 Tax=Brachyhypopomus gauderio TaxID=698409 RepID=UPI004043504E